MVADALSRLPISSLVNVDKEDDGAALEDAFDVSMWRQLPQPIMVAEIGKKQKNDPYIRQLEEQAPDCLGEIVEVIGRKSGPDKCKTEIDPHVGKARVIIPVELRN